MDDVAKNILAAWEKLGPAILEKSGEVMARVSRCRKDLLSRPMRAWCLAIRAGDRRMTTEVAAIVPEESGYPEDCIAPEVRKKYINRGRVENEVVVDAKLVKVLCRAVEMGETGHRNRELAAMLGIHRSSVSPMMKAGKLIRTKFAWSPRPRFHGLPVMDPCALNGKQRPDEILGEYWKTLAERLSEDFQQTIVRVPKFRNYRGGKEFTGWRWVCPGCGGKKRILYYPVRPVNVLEKVEIGEEARAVWEEMKEAGGGGGFACEDCHRVVGFTRVDSSYWNILICQLSGGLLYGAEVERPGWFVKSRKRAFLERKKREIWPTRKRALEMILEGKRAKEIARELGLKKQTINMYAYHWYKKYGVHGAGELREKMRGGGANIEH